MIHVDTTLIDAVCPDCGKVHAVGDSLNEMSLRCMELTLSRMGHLARKEDNDVPFLEMELAATLSLAEMAQNLGPEIMALIEPYLHENMSVDQVMDAIERAKQLWQEKVYDEETSQAWIAAILLALLIGTRQASQTAVIDAIYRDRMIAAMAKAGKFYAEKFFETRVVPSLFAAVDKAINGNTLAASTGYKLVQDALSKGLKDTAYWNVVANAATSRAYHYGLLRGGLVSGYTGVRFIAILDERTSDICRALSGVTWPLYQAMDLMERVAQAETPDEVKNITPWVKADTIKGMSPNELAGIGVMVPPLHGRCRSVLELF